MPSLINASTSSGIIQTADTSGVLELQSNGTTRLSVLSTGVSGTLVQGTAVASTSGTSIDFTSIPSWVKRITVMLRSVSTNGTSNIQVQIGSGSITTSGYICAIANIDGTNATSISSATSGFIAKAGVAAATTYTGTMALNLFTDNTWLSTNNTSGSNGLISFSNGSLALGGALDRVRITTVNGTDTFDAGSINIQYEG